MKKFSACLITIILCTLTLITTSCKNSEPEVLTGTIVGKALYTNQEDSSGIHITLESNESRSVTESYANNITATTDKDGSYMFTDVPIGSYIIYASISETTEDSVLTTILVKENETVIANDLKLTLFGSVSGKIILNESETGNQGFTVFLGGTKYLSKTDNAGNFSITQVPIGKDYEVYVEKGTYTSYWKKINIETNKDTDLGTKKIYDAEISGESAAIVLNSNIIWRGSYDSEETVPEPEENDVYFNTITGSTYIYLEGNWSILLSDNSNNQNITNNTEGKDSVNNSNTTNNTTNNNTNNNTQNNSNNQNTQDSQSSNTNNSTSQTTGLKLTDFYYLSIPTKTTYNANDPIDFTGLSLEACYEDGSSKIIPISSCKVSGFDSRVPVYTQKVIITYTEGTITKELSYSIHYNFSWSDKIAVDEERKNVYFGYFPQTICKVTIDKETAQKVIKGDNTYYLGPDGWYYCEAVEKAYKQYASDIVYYEGISSQQANEYNSTKPKYNYFRVEPIKWKIISKNYKQTGNCLLITDRIIMSGISWTDNVTSYGSNYKYSKIRSYLNGNHEPDDTISIYQDKGFLNTAFVSSSITNIETTHIDNSLQTGVNKEGTIKTKSDYLSPDTDDKVFLLSLNETTRAGFGFESNATKIKTITDFALTNYSNKSWGLRTPSSTYSFNVISANGEEWSMHANPVSNPCLIGIAPCICISSELLK